MTAAREIDAVFVMADLSGFTALTEAHGSLKAADVVARYMELVRGALEDGVRFVERVGDGILLVADEAAPAVRTAIRLREAIEREPLFPMVRIGLNAGRVVERGYLCGSGRVLGLLIRRRHLRRPDSRRSRRRRRRRSETCEQRPIIRTGLPSSLRI